MSPSLLLLVLGVQCIAEDFADNKFTDGVYFSAIWESEHYSIVPYVHGSHWRHNWLVCWNIGSMKEGQANFPTQTFFLDTLRSPLYIGCDFRASEPRSLILREDIDNHRLAESIKGHPEFLALWQPERATSGGAVFVFKHLGVFDETSTLISDLEVPPIDGVGFSRSAVWDYAHSKVFFYSKRTLSEFDYANHTVTRFSTKQWRVEGSIKNQNRIPHGVI